MDDLVQVLDRLRLLDLGDDRQPHALLVHDLVHDVDVGGAADERERDPVGAQRQGPAQVGLVLVAHRGNAHRHAGQVQALVVRDHAALDHPGGDTRALDRDDLDRDLAVVDQDAVTDAGVARQALVRGGREVLVARDVLGGDREE